MVQPTTGCRTTFCLPKGMIFSWFMRQAKRTREGLASLAKTRGRLRGASKDERRLLAGLIEVFLGSKCHSAVKENIRNLRVCKCQCSMFSYMAGRFFFSFFFLLFSSAKGFTCSDVLPNIIENTKNTIRTIKNTSENIETALANSITKSQTYFWR